MRLPDFEAWAIFATVAERRSFTAAASALGLSKATVSKAVTRLEAHLGTPLFHRTSRRLALTDSGAALAVRAARILADAEDAEEAAREEAAAPSGLVRVAAPMSFGIAHVGPSVAGFLEAYPGIRIDLHLSDERMDLIAGGFDMALRIASLPDSSLRARKIRDVARYVVAAPAYLAKYGTPRHPAELAHHRCLTYAYLASETWSFTGPGGEQASVRPDGPIHANNSDAMLPALRRGLGIAALPDFIVDPDLAAGTLVPILTEWRGPPIALNLVTPPGTIRPKRVQALMDWFADTLCREPPR